MGILEPAQIKKDETHVVLHASGKDFILALTEND